MKELINFLLARQPEIYEKVLLFKGKASREKLTFIKLVENGDVVLDIGANKGQYTVLFSHLVGPEGKVHAFEPIEPTYQRLSYNVRTKKRFNNVDLNLILIAMEIK
ncbi:MAG: FkbM family methyltransferase [Xenococcaceae cyanobacterium]